MRNRTLWLASALMVTLVLVGTAVAQPPDRNPGPPRRPGDRDDRGLTVDQIVERLMSFGKNSDGKITKDELPERMQDLIARGDTNKDGALDKDEIRALAARLQREGFPGGPGGGLAGGPGGGPPPGRPGGNFDAAGIERALAD